jgi:hypothetical protein
VWNAATGQVIAKLEGHSGAVFDAAFSPDGQRVVTASADKTARVWNASSGQVIARLEGHSGEVTSAAFSPDGQRVVTASLDHTERVWNAATGQVIAKLEGHSGEVFDAAFSPDGQRVVTASGDEANKQVLLTQQAPTAAPVVSLDANSVSPSNYDALLAEGQQKLKQGRPAEARLVADRLIRIGPNRWEGWALAAQSSPVTDAVELYERALALAPADARPNVERQLEHVRRLGLGARRPLILRGKVIMADGSPPPKSVGIERVCSDITLRPPALPSQMFVSAGPVTNRKGEYLWLMELDPASTRPCSIGATLEGYTSTWIDISAYSDFNLPPLVLTPTASAVASQVQPLSQGVQQLSAPQQQAPANGTVFGHFPRSTALVWQPVPGARSYSVEHTFLQPGKHCSSVSPGGMVVTGLAEAFYFFNFVGAQPGCWRVWAVDNQGREGSKSPWWEFVYTQ